MPRVAAVIPTLGTDADRLVAAVEAVWAQSAEVELEVIVVVNGAPREETTALDARTRVLTTGINLGWGGGLHVGRAATEAEFLWLVQDDSYPQEHCLRELVAVLDAAPQQALVSPIVVRTEIENDASPTVPYARRASWGGVLAADGTMDRWEPKRDIPIDEIGEIPDLDYVPSRGMLVRTSVWDEVGGTDLRAFPVGWVDVLLCSAARAAGHTIGLAPAARIRHDRSASTPTILNGYVRERGPRLLRESAAPLAEASADVPDHVLRATLASATASVLELAHYAERTTVPLARHEALEQQLERVRRERDRARHELDALRGSLSWRVTAPLRALRGLLRRRT
jgi:GT2 family glycosyltransferase